MVSIPFHDRTYLGGGLGAFLLLGTLIVLGMSSCDPLAGTGPGAPPDPKTYIHVDAATRTAVVTLIAGHPATDIQFNYDGYGNGALVLTVPTEWQVTIQCVNHGTVPNSCAVVADGEATTPVQPGWSTSDPRRGLDPGQSASFTFTPTATGSYRIASLVDGNEASGMWADLEIGASGIPNLVAQ